jgi:GT2 family glycosyltransferase
LDSIASQSVLSNAIVVDYGSFARFKTWHEEMFKKYPFVTLVNVTRDTDDFNKSRSLNIGLKVANHTPYVLFCDIDNLYSPNFTEEVLKILKNNKAMVLCRRIDLDEQGNEVGLHEPSAVGNCQAVSREWFNKVHGFDEVYIHCGRQDNDLVDRAVQDGLQLVWVHDRVKLLHQWHEPPEWMTHPALMENVHYYEIPNKPIIRNLEKWGEI